jgi:hypothetical protein
LPTSTTSSIAADYAAADLQLASTIGLLMALADVRPLIEGRPCEAPAWALVP